MSVEIGLRTVEVTVGDKPMARRREQEIVKPKVWVAVISITTVAIAGATSAYNHFPHARLLPVEDRYDFGDVSPNQELSHTFRLTRSGLGTLKVVQVATSCECLDALLRDVPGGWTIELKMRAEQLLGEKSAYAWIETDEPDRRRHRFQLRCRVTNPFNITPLPPDFGVVESDHASAVRLELSVAREEGFEAPEISIVDQVEPSSVRFIDPRQKSRYTLGFSDPAPVGPLTAAIRISFKGNIPAPTEFPIRGMIVGDTYAWPYEIQSIWEQFDRPFKTRSELIADKPGSSRAFQIEQLFGALSDPSDLDAVLVKEGERTFFEVRLRPGSRWSRGAKCRGAARIRSGEKAIIQIPVVINIPLF